MTEIEVLRVIVRTGCKINHPVKGGNQPLPPAHARRDVNKRQPIKLRVRKPRRRRFRVYTPIIFATRLDVLDGKEQPSALYAL